MKVLFTGSFPLALVLLIMVLAVCFLLYIYKRQQLPKPWCYLLPVCRILAVVLLILSLLQPVLAWVKKEVVKGRIAVVIDDSASMSVVDNYDGEVRLKAAQLLGLLEESVLNLCQPETEKETLVRLHDRCALLRNQLKRLRTPAELQFEDLRKTLSELRGGLNDAYEGIVLPDRIASLLEADKASQHQMLHGKVLQEYYQRVPGWDVTQDDVKELLAKTPDYSRLTNGFRLTSRNDDGYVIRARTLLKPAVSGEYRFCLSADDTARLFVSKPGGRKKQQVAAVSYWVKEAGDFEEYPEQIGAPVRLEKGKTYKLELLYKENAGEEHLSVAWMREGQNRNPVRIPRDLLRAAELPLEMRELMLRFQRCQEHLRGVVDRIGNVEAAFSELADQTSDARRVGVDFNVAVKTFDVAVDKLRQTIIQFSQLEKSADEALLALSPQSVRDAMVVLQDINRQQIAVSLLADNGPLSLQQLRRLGPVDLFPLNPEVNLLGLPHEQLRTLRPNRPESRIEQTIEGILDYYETKRVAVILLLSDGNTLTERGGGHVAKLLEDREVPCFTVGIGDRTPSDSRIRNVEVPKSAFVGDRLVFSVEIERQGFEQIPIELVLSSDGKVLSTTELPAGGRAVERVRMSFTEERSGVRQYQVVLRPPDRDICVENNQWQETVRIRSRPVRVLMIEGYPRRESRMIERMLERDARIEINHFYINRDKVEKGARDHLQDGKLNEYDCLVMGDLDPELLGKAELEAIEGFVSDGGGGLVIMAGEYFMPVAYRETDLFSVFPFNVQPPKVGVNADEGAVDAQLNRVELTAVGSVHPAVQLSNSTSVNEQLWQNLPRPSWVCPSVFPAPNARVLVRGVLGEQSVRRDLPVVLTGAAGLGRILYLGTDQFWRWRAFRGERYHYRLWGQVLLWAAAGRGEGYDRFVKLNVPGKVFATDERIPVTLRVVAEDGEPLEDASVSIDLVNDAGKIVRTLRLKESRVSAGEYGLELSPLLPGRYRVIPHVLELEGYDVKATASFSVRAALEKEMGNVALDDRFLKRLGQQYTFFAESEDLLDAIPAVENVESTQREVEIWNSFWFMVVVTLLLTAEWYWRRQIHQW